MPAPIHLRTSSGPSLTWMVLRSRNVRFVTPALSGRGLISSSDDQVSMRRERKADLHNLPGQAGSIPCALMTGIATGPVRKLIKLRAASGTLELELIPATNEA